MKLQFQLKKNSIQSLRKSIGMNWVKYRSVIFLTYFVVVVICGGYYWYKSIYASSWTAQQKEAYMKEKDKTVILNERDLANAIEKLNQRRSEYDSQPEGIRNIFAPY